MLRYLFQCYFLFFGFQTVGLEIFGFNFTMSTIIMLLAFPFITLGNISLNKTFIVHIVIFILWALLSTLLRFSTLSSLLSLPLILFFSVPLAIVNKNKYYQHVDKFLYFGILLILPFVIYDLCVTFLNANPLEEFVVFFKNSNSTKVFGFYRVKATFDEPSYFGIYLVSLLFYFLEINSRYKKNAIWIISLLIPLTFSLTAFVLTVVVLTIRYTKSFWRLSFFYLIIFTLISILPTYGGFFHERILLTVESLISGNISGSEGSRSNSIIVMLNYLRNADFHSFFMGEGYGRYDKWLMQNFSGFNEAMVSYARGQINNTIAVVGISLGFVGLFIYLKFFFSLVKSKLLSQKALVLHLFIQFSFGFLVGYFFWGIILIFMLIQNFNQEHKKNA